MNQNDRELMERYIAAATRRLSKRQRREAELELRERIGDMTEAGDSMEEALTRLGDPKGFSRQYQDGPHYLIGPEYFDTYLWFVRVVLICVGVTLLAVSAVEGLREGLGAAEVPRLPAAAGGAVFGLVRGLGRAVTACMGAFGGITLLFAILERRNLTLDGKKARPAAAPGEKGGWTPAALAALPHEKALIHRGDSAAGIVFLLVFALLLTFAPQLFGAVLVREGEAVATIPVFNLEQWNLILPVLLLWLAVGLGDEVFRLAAGRYCRPVMLCNIFCNAAMVVLAFLALELLPIWNPEFAAQLEAQFGGTGNEAAEFFIRCWDGELVSGLLLAVIVAAALVETAGTVYRTLRYGERSGKKAE